jgi:hypothetical protein
MRVHVYLDQKDGSLKRARSVDVPDNSATPEADAWRTVSRGGDLAEGTYRVMRAGRRARIMEARVLQATDLGADT